MSRVIDAFTQYFDGNGQPLSNGTLTFYENGGTSTLQDTYADITQTIPNANPFQLDGEGRVATDIYGSIAYTVVLKDSDNNVIEQFDNVEPRGGIITGNTIPDWDSTTDYNANNSIVFAGDGEYYIATQDNMNQNPVTDTTFQYWKRVELKEEWSQFLTYDNKAIVIGSDNIQYESLIGSNLNNDPVGDGGVNWEQYNTINWSIGRAYLSGESRLADNGRWYTAVINNTGNNPIADDGTNWLPSVGKVDKPSNVSPADAATDVLRTPTLTSSAFSVSGGTDTHEYSRWQVATDSGFASVIYDSDITSSNLTSNQVGMMLDPATTFYFRERYKGEFAGLSDWSDGTSFTTVPDLAAVFNISSTTGTGASRTIVTGVDLSAESGSIWLFNRTAGNFVKRLDTSRGTDELDLGANTADTINAQGVTAYTSSGFTVGTDVNYNGNTNTISAYVYQNRAGFHDTVTYIGNALSRTISHNLGIEVGAAIFKNRDDADAQSYFYFTHKDSIGAQPTTRIVDVSAQVDSETGAYLGSTASDFSISASGRINESGKNYIVELFAHNPAQGVFCGSYTPTGSSGQKIVTGFPVGKVIFFGNGNNSAVASGGGMSIADKVTGTGSHIRIESTGSSIVGGSVQSFDSDGFTLDSGRLNNNSFAGNYGFIAIADPALF